MMVRLERARPAMASDDKRASEAKLVGGALCLDLINTVGWRGREGDHERLRSYDDLVDWGRHAQAVTQAEARRLKRLARERPQAAKAALMRARALREATHRLFARL